MSNWITEHKAHELRGLHSKQLRDHLLPRPHRGYSDEMRRRIMLEMVIAGAGGASKDTLYDSKHAELFDSLDNVLEATT